MAKTPKVRLYIRIRRSNGTDAFVDPAWNRKRTLREGYALMEGELEHHPEGVYYLRFLRNGKRVWERIGQDADVAVVALRNTEHDLQSMALGRSAPVPVVSPQTSVSPNLSIPAPVAALEAGFSPGSVSLKDAIESYLKEIRRSRSPKTIAACEHMLNFFESRLPGKLVKGITREDLLDHKAALKEKGLGDRTIYNHIMRIGILLKTHGVVRLLSTADIPQYEEKEVKAYNPDELASMFAAANREERMLFEFFLATGFREQEVMYSTWGNVDFTSKVISVRSKPGMGFRIKDKEERSVPVPDTLIASLTARKRESTSMLVFPGTNDKPNGHFLQLLQHLAFRAGLNCGECVTKKGQRCSNRPVCSEWGLHKFRKTFATMHSDAGVSAPTIQRWLGHSDLATTLRYLAIADLRSERTRNQVNSTFAALSVGGAA
jgi:integrase/recombinase XerD